jgi:hypothetical protein
MDTPAVITKGGPIPSDERIYRALNPSHVVEGGLPSDNHFVMKQNAAPGDGVSTGIASLVTISELRSIEAIRRFCGEEFGVAELVVSDVLAPVAAFGIAVLQKDAPDWGKFSGAHAVITGYQALAGNEGKRKRREFQRHLVKLARRRYYAAGSDTAVSVV